MNGMVLKYKQKGQACPTDQLFQPYFWSKVAILDSIMHAHSCSSFSKTNNPIPLHKNIENESRLMVKFQEMEAAEQKTIFHKRGCTLLLLLLLSLKPPPFLERRAINSYYCL